MPPGAEAVVMQEDCEAVEPAAGAGVRIRIQPKPGQWIRRRGEDVAADAVVLARGQRLSPVHGKVEMAAAIVDFANFARRIAVELEELADGQVERLGEDLRLGVLVGLRQIFGRRAQREKLAERIPAQIAFLLELLHVLGRRAAGTGLEKTAARQQRNDRQHLGRGAELHDREQVGSIITQHVASDGDRVLPLANAFK